MPAPVWVNVLGGPRPPKRYYFALAMDCARNSLNSLVSSREVLRARVPAALFPFST